MLPRGCGGAFLIKSRIYSIEVFRIELFDRISQTFTEALIVYDLSLAQEFYNIINIGIIG